MEHNLLLTQTGRKHGHELGPEHLAQCLHWKKEIPGILGASLQMMPHTILIHTATSYDAVDVRMVEEVGAPCMKYARHSPLQPMALIELPQGVPCGTEHAGVEQLLMRHGYWMQAVGNGEDHMEVLHARHHLFFAHLYPYLTLLVLALGAMTVSAAVVADMDVATLGADLHMTTQCSCAADGHRRERLPNLRHAYPPGVSLSLSYPLGGMPNGNCHNCHVTLSVLGDYKSLGFNRSNLSSARR